MKNATGRHLEVGVKRKLAWSRLVQTPTETKEGALTDYDFSVTSQRSIPQEPRS